jgi:hypothetical protein
METKKPEMVVCPKPEQMMICPKAKRCKHCQNNIQYGHRKPHEHRLECDMQTFHCPACVPVSPPEPVKLYKCAPEDSSLWKCNWTECLGGCGLAGNGMCSDRGEWDNPNCPKFNKVPAHMYDKPEPVNHRRGRNERICRF